MANFSRARPSVVAVYGKRSHGPGDRLIGDGGPGGIALTGRQGSLTGMASPRPGGFFYAPTGSKYGVTFGVADSTPPGRIAAWPRPVPLHRGMPFGGLVRPDNAILGPTFGPGSQDTAPTGSGIVRGSFASIATAWSLADDRVLVLCITAAMRRHGRQDYLPGEQVSHRAAARGAHQARHGPALGPSGDRMRGGVAPADQSNLAASAGTRIRDWSARQPVTRLRHGSKP